MTDDKAPILLKLKLLKEIKNIAKNENVNCQKNKEKIKEFNENID